MLDFLLRSIKIITNKSILKTKLLSEIYYFFFFKNEKLKKAFLITDNNIDDKNLDFIKRICKFYNYCNDKNDYSDLGLWDKIFYEKSKLKSYKFVNTKKKHSHKQFHDLLINHNYRELYWYFNNFGSLEISSGTSTNLFDEFFYRDFLTFEKSLNLNEENISILKKKNESLGGYNTSDDEFVPYAGPRTFYAAKVINGFKKKNILEIGSGFGLLPYYLFNKLNFKGNYFNLDLPLISVIFAYFNFQNLSSDIKIRFINELDQNEINDIDNLKKTIVCVDHNFFYKQNLSDIDLFLNIDSFSEFSSTNLKKIIERIQVNKSKLFFSINHELEYKFYNPKKKENEVHQNLSKLIDNYFKNSLKIRYKKIIKNFDRHHSFKEILFEIN
jgi:hypothetical protein